MLIQELTLQGILSFGPETPPLEMRPLNVLIGANGSGKSNLIEAIGLMRSAPEDLAEPVRRAGGVGEWIWKGHPPGDGETATLEAVIAVKCDDLVLRHKVAFVEAKSLFRVIVERIDQLHQESVELQTRPYHLYEVGDSDKLYSKGHSTSFKRDQRYLDSSILGFFYDPINHVELTDLNEAYNDIRIYRDWSFGRSSVLRTPQPADIPADRLAEDFSNLGMFLNRLRRNPAAKKAIIGRLRDLYDGLDDFDVSVVGGKVEVVLTEGNFTIPASRLSDGTLRYLCLLAILCDPDPPRVVCIEEPELGLHPDLLPTLARLLIEASQRMQLIVTTHSDILVDALSETPESVVVVEKHDGKTEMKRLANDEELQDMLNDYRLGQLWIQGQIGGTRW